MPHQFAAAFGHQRDQRVLIGIGQALGRGFGQEVFGVVQKPPPQFVDPNRHHLVLGLVDGVYDIARRLQGHFVLCGLPAEQHPHADLFFHFIAPDKRSKCRDKK